MCRWMSLIFAWITTAIPLEGAEAADLYRRIGALGRLFISIESEAFALPS